MPRQGAAETLCFPPPACRMSSYESFPDQGPDAESSGLARPRVLDLRALPAPEPLVRALAAADALAPGASLDVLTPMLPVPLLQQLMERGLRANAELLADGSARVRVYRP